MGSMNATVSSTGDQTEVIEFLSSPSSYGLTQGVERHETHGAIVFLAGERAYKLKRAVKFPYMDYSTAARRREMCEQELAVNRRTAPSLYLDVRTVVRTAGGALGFGPRDAADALDWVVVMRRFDQAALLEQMRRCDGLTSSMMTTLAETLADFHKAAEITPKHGGARGISDVIGEDALMFKIMAGRHFAPEKLDRLARLAWRSLDQHSALLDRRRQDGFVRRCHGDLHLNNICLVHGLPVLFDAIEFNDDFSCIDVFYDLAFLLMDLDHHGLRAHANTVLNRYLEMTADYGGVTVLPLFLSCRAAVRAHVSVAGAQASGERSGRMAEESRSLLDSAIRYLEPSPPGLIAVGGLSGTGKSTLARRLAPALGLAPGAVILRSDVIRKTLFGAPDTQRLPASAYAAEVTQRVFTRIADTAGQLLSAGYTVVADAVYASEEQREQIAAVAAGAGVPFRGLWLAAPQPLLEKRISARRRDASDATVEILHQQLGYVQEPGSWARIDASAPADEIAAQVLQTPIARS